MCTDCIISSDFKVPVQIQRPYFTNSYKSSIKYLATEIELKAYFIELGSLLKSQVPIHLLGKFCAIVIQRTQINECPQTLASLLFHDLRRMSAVVTVNS